MVSLEADDTSAPLFFLEGDAGSTDLVAKKRPRSDHPAEESWRRRYLGTFVLCGYSMTKGSDYIHAGDRVLIQRKAKATAKPKGTRGRGGKKQDRADYVVRFSNTRGTFTRFPYSTRF